MIILRPGDTVQFESYSSALPETSGWKEATDLHRTFGLAISLGRTLGQRQRRSVAKILLGAIACGASFSACGSEQVSSRDCNPRVEFNNVIYAYVGQDASGISGVRLGNASLAHCHDIGQTGDDFSTGSAGVPVIKVQGVDPGREIWVVQNGDRYLYKSEAKDQ